MILLNRLIRGRVIAREDANLSAVIHINYERRTLITRAFAVQAQSGVNKRAACRSFSMTMSVARDP